MRVCDICYPFLVIFLIEFKVQSSKFIDKSAKHLPLAIYIDFKIWQRQSNIVKINIQTPYNYTFTSNIKQNYETVKFSRAVFLIAKASLINFDILIKLFLFLVDIYELNF